MKLQGELYKTVSSSCVEEGRGRAVVELIPESSIYKAHFPGMPVTPGVCLVQMCLDVISEALGRNVTLSSAKDIRFLVPVIPGREVELTVDYTLSGDFPDMDAAVTICCGENCHAKMKLTLAACGN